jgi:energy-converting hydrogenase Eha subunit A
MINPNFVYLGVFLQFLGGMSYLVDTIKGTVKPNRVTWFMWILAPALAFFAQLQQGVGPEVWATFIVWFVPFLVFIASFVNKKAQWKIQRLDIICGVLSLIGLILWLITKVGNVAIIFSIFADLLACIPTIVKSWHEPETESSIAFFAGILNAGLGLLVIKTWNFENYAFLTYLFIASTVLAVLIQFKIGKLFAAAHK